jgi:flagella basal body P-ring formation protein FlgA
MTGLLLLACLAIAPESDRITARDLAAAEPALAAVPPDTVASLAPVPGARRVFSTAQLARFAARYGVVAEPRGTLCFERPTHPLEPGALLEAMRRGFSPSRRIELVDWSRFEAPEGALEFPRAGLGPPAPGGHVALWKGYVRYGGRRRFPIWARVRIPVSHPLVLAVEDLRPGAPIESRQVRWEPSQDPVAGTSPGGDVPDVVGLIPRRLIRAGEPVDPEGLARPRAVERGSMVRVQASAGGARIAAQAVAESAGVRGQVISLRNPASGKRFRARVEGPGAAIIQEAQR